MGPFQGTWLALVAASVPFGQSWLLPGPALPVHHHAGHRWGHGAAQKDSGPMVSTLERTSWPRAQLASAALGEPEVKAESCFFLELPSQSKVGYWSTLREWIATIPDNTPVLFFDRANDTMCLSFYDLDGELRRIEWSWRAFDWASLLARRIFCSPDEAILTRARARYVDPHELRFKEEEDRIAESMRARSYSYTRMVGVLEDYNSRHGPWRRGSGRRGRRG
uniref:Uncharacterized protein n=1 Tax=Rhizochromulina marina TaxID=1034831 RepID=A0A7S2SST5_9STRA|mmetsp:Transcript_655/g.2038  ORF Transcript_655/g.2038 Transcript_655/m.2038 type:complete len:222 (+) Transcript_655:143-808(+)